MKMNLINKDMLVKNPINLSQSLYKILFYAKMEDIVFKKELIVGYHNIKNDKLRIINADYEKMNIFYRENPGLRKQSHITRSYLDNNYHGELAELDGKIVGYSWWSDAQISNPEYRHPHLKRYDVELKSNEVWGFDLFILPDFRGRSIASDFLYLCHKHIREKGYTRVLGFANKDNLPSIRLHKQHKYEPVKTVISHLFLGMFLYSNAGGGMWFIRNVSFWGKQRFDYRFLF